MMPLNSTPSERESNLHDQMTARIVNEERVARLNEKVVGNRDAQKGCDDAGAGNRRIGAAMTTPKAKTRRGASSCAKGSMASRSSADAMTAAVAKI